ncbi:MAG: PAS domain S-box protein [bacterium]
MVVCLGVSGWFVLQYSRNIVTRKICDGDRNFAARVAQEIEAELADIKPTLTLLAQTPELRLMDAAKIPVGVDRVRRAFPEITGVCVADMEGMPIYRTGSGQLENVSRMPNFQVASRGDKVFSDIYIEPTTLEPIQTITLPIIADDGRTVVGVIFADISYRRIMRSFMGVNIGDDGNVLVIANHGTVIAHTNLEQVQGVDLSGLPVVKAVLAGESGTMKGYTDELGREALGTYMPVGKLGWGVLIQRPISNMYAEVGRLRTVIIWVVIAGVLIVLPAGWLMARQIAGPVGQLAGAAKRVAQGDLSTSVEVISSNEIGMLAHSFNQMVISLKKARDELQEWSEALEQSRNALRKSEERFRQFFENAPAYCYIVSPEDMILDVNKAALDTLCYRKEHLVGKPLQSVYAPESLQKIRRLTAMRQETGELRNEEMVIITKEGNRRIVLFSVNTNRDEEGDILNSVAVQQDITEHKKAEEERENLQKQLLQSQKMEAIGQFVGAIAHDFNNLLTPILCLSDLSVHFLSDKKALRSNFTEIKTATIKGRDLIAQLLAFSRKQVLRPETLNLNDLVSNISKMLVRIIGEDIELNIRPADKLGNISIDPVQAEQIIMNLAINAKAAMPKGGKLTFETANVELDENYVKSHVDMSPGSYIMLAISDSGAGMEKEIIAHIFEPFFTTKGDKGSGLGLSTVYGIVKQSGGDIRVYSEPGQGTTFKIYFPRIYGKADIIAKEQISKKSLKGTETILVVEDEKMVRETIHQILKVFGYNPLLASNGAEAEKLIKKYKDEIHMLITDIILPGKLNGKETAEHIIRERPDIKTLFISGYTENAIVENGILAVNINFLQKPFDSNSLAKKIRGILDAPKANQ